MHLEIIDGKEDIIQWSDNYVTVRSNYQEIQRELSELVISALNRVIGIETELPQREEVDLVAYTDYLNGIFFSKLRGEQPLRASIEAFNSALARQPEFQNARVALAHVLALLPFYSEQDEIRAFAEATRQLDALNGAAFAEAEAIRGFIAFRQWYWLQAEAHFIESLQANPNLANTHLWYSQFLSTVGRLEESLQQARMAYELDAVSPVVNDRLATAYLWLDQDEEALRRFATGASLGFDSFQNPGFLILLWRDRDYEQIRAGLRALHPGADLDPLLDNLEYLDVPDARTELVSMVDRLVLQQQLIPRLEFGVWIVLEQWERAVATIEKYSETKKNLDIEFLFAREAAGLREDPLFAEVTGRLGLENYWRNAVPSDFR